MARRPGVPAVYGEEFSFVSPLVKYLLFFFNMLFWVRFGGGGQGAPGLSGIPGAPRRLPEAGRFGLGCPVPRSVSRGAS